MNRIISLFATGRVYEKLWEIYLSVIPALIVGILVLAAYFLAVKFYQIKKQEDKVQKVRDAAPYFYFVFVVALWLSHHELLPARRYDFSFAPTIHHIFFFVVDTFVFLIQGYLFGLKKDKPLSRFLFCVVASVILELIQYFFMVGTLSAVHFTAMVLGSGVGIFVGASLRKMGTTLFKKKPAAEADPASAG